MNAVEIEEAISKLAESPFDPAGFPYAFLEAFGNKETTIRRLRSTGRGSTNQSDIGGVLQRNNIHIKVGPFGQVTETLAALRESPATSKQKAKFILATDGQGFEAENLVDGETISCDYPDFHNHFGFFLPLAGISTVKQIRENAFDIKATGRLNKLYVELLRNNPDWDTNERRVDLNHFFARLIFCYFAEDTGIFHNEGLFTSTIDQMSERDGSNMDFVIGEIFRAMNTKIKDRKNADLRSWADIFPYVNGNLFGRASEGDHPYADDIPKFSQIARSYLIHIGNLDWTKINPDIFGSMIQAVADDSERGALGMHYTSVPNILKLLNPLFLDDLREKLTEAGDGKTQGSLRKLLNLRERIKRIRVFDPACGSGNFLVIAYKEMRAIEAEINYRRGEKERASEIPLTNFRGIEIRHFSCEIARLALIIAEYQCNALHRSEDLARMEFLPLNKENWITCENALRLNWLGVCPPEGTRVKIVGDYDMFSAPVDQIEIDFENQAGETFICGNPPYLGRKYQSDEQKDDLQAAFIGRCKDILSLDYVSGWLIKATDYMRKAPAKTSFVCTNSVCQGIQVPSLWPVIFALGITIDFAYTSFTWSNLASHNAGVTVCILGLTSEKRRSLLFYTNRDGSVEAKAVSNINAYLVPGENVFVKPRQGVPDQRSPMQFGNHPYYANSLILTYDEKQAISHNEPELAQYIRPLYGSKEFVDSNPRYRNLSMI